MNQQQANYVRQPIAPPSHIAYAHKLGRGMLTFEQIDELVKAINPLYVEKKQKLTYLAQHQARAEMNRIFGYGNWDVDAGEPVLMYETQQPGSGDKANKLYWVVAYRIKITVSIRDLWGMPVASFTGVHAEENAPQPNRGEAHALALTSVDSYALRRALINLGDRFGLGLYNGGSTAPHGQYSIQQMSGQVFQWVEAKQPPTPAPVPVVTHETINAEQAVPEYDGTEQGQATPPRSARMEEFHQTREQLQADREQARQQPMSPEMRARLQQGLKVDGFVAGEMNG